MTESLLAQQEIKKIRILLEKILRELESK